MVSTVSALIKEIHGAEALAVRDREFNEGVLAEDDPAFFARDDPSSIPSLGEYLEECGFVRWEFLGAPKNRIAGLPDVAGGHERKDCLQGVGEIQIGGVNNPEGEALVIAGRR